MPREINAELELPVMEQFYTIQGEGYYTGRAAYFIRLAGCDVGCVWCDVKESWEADQHPVLSISSLCENVRVTKADFVVITGGEPAMYDLRSLVNQLHDLGIEIAIETSGCYPLLGDVDWYCFSPKKFKTPCAEAFERANELKVIINHVSDLDWAEQQAEKLNKKALKYLQPEWSKQERMLPPIIERVKKNPSWKISLQTHKFMNIP